LLGPIKPGIDGVGEGSSVGSIAIWVIGRAAVAVPGTSGINILGVAAGVGELRDVASRNGLEGGALISDLDSKSSSWLQATSNKSNSDNIALCIKIERRIKAYKNVSLQEDREEIPDRLTRFQVLY
jgi:hypothetical protein